MSPYVAPIIVCPRKVKSGAPLAETKGLVIDYQDLNKKILKYKLHKQNQKAA